MKWAYGVTTVKQRFETYLPRTLRSLAAAGFDNPRLFIDGPDRPNLALEMTNRLPFVGIYANWVLSLTELVLRATDADFYALFQDDVIACIGLREYIEQVYPPTPYYLNLFTSFENDEVLKKQLWSKGWHQAWASKNGTVCPDGSISQSGRGAVALVFTRPGALAFLRHRIALDHSTDPVDGRCKVDGAVVESLCQSGFREWVHNPSLVQHIGGDLSTHTTVKWPLASTFPGETFDVRTLIHQDKPKLILRSEFVAEIERIKKSMRDDEVRLKRAMGSRADKLREWLQTYADRLKVAEAALATLDASS